MQYSMEEGIAELTPFLKERRLIVFAGAGVSVDSGIPAWAGVVDALIEISESIQIDLSPDKRFDKLIDDAKALRGKDPTKVASVLKRRLLGASQDPAVDKNTINTQLRREFLRMFSNGAPNKNHDLIVETDYPFIITTNYDDFFPTSAKNLGFNQLRKNAFTFEQADSVARCIYEDKPAIIYLHGNLLDVAIDNLILTVEDYQRVKTQYPGFTLAIQSLFLRYSVLFVGYGGVDPHLEELMEGLAYVLNWPSKASFPLRYFMAVQENDANEVLSEYRDMTRTELIVLKNYPQMTELLAELANIAPRPASP